jgi:hypothetical protein
MITSDDDDDGAVSARNALSFLHTHSMNLRHVPLVATLTPTSTPTSSPIEKVRPGVLQIRKMVDVDSFFRRP